MTSAAVSLDELIVRFTLRARATRQEYRSGRHLAEAGAVSIMRLDPSAAKILVTDGRDQHEVLLAVLGSGLDAACPCGRRPVVCRHAVAAEHALWRRLTP